MCIKFNTSNIKNINSSSTPITLRQLDSIKENDSPKSNSVLDNYKVGSISKGSPGEKKDSSVHLINPVILFSKNSVQDSIMSQSQTQEHKGVTLHWDKQFNDPSVASGSAPRGFVSTDTVKGIPMAKLIDAAKQILAKKQSLGTCTPVNIDGWSVLAVDQTHHYTFREGKKVEVPEGLHGVSLYIKKDTLPK